MHAIFYKKFQLLSIRKALFVYFLVNLERWCRLRGNLLFYFKTKDPWSEPVGVVVLEQCQVRLEPPTASVPLTSDGHFPFYLGKKIISFKTK